MLAKKLLSTEETSKPCIFILGQSKPNQWPPVFENTLAQCLYESSKVWSTTCPRPVSVTDKSYTHCMASHNKKKWSRRPSTIHQVCKEPHVQPGFL